MKFPFYRNEDKTYTIDDANYECWRVIVADCPNSHRYATLCELIEDCPGIKQLTRPCIVEALNDLQKLWQQSWLEPQKRFLKIGSDGCLEVANPCICNEWDRLVVATDEDNDPGPLSTKVRGSCSEDWLYCIDIEVAWPKTLVWRPSGPNGPFIDADTPECDVDTAYVKMRKTGGKWKVEYECVTDDTWPDYLYAYHSWWETYDSCSPRGRSPENNSTIYYAVNNTCTNKPTWQEYSHFSWWRFIEATDAFEPVSTNSYWVFKITKPWIYYITFSTMVSSLYYSNIWHALRAWLRFWVNNYFVEWWDIKYEAWGVNGRLNRMHPQNWDPWLFMQNHSWWTSDFSALPFSRTYILNVQSVPIEVAMVVKPETAIDARIVDDADNDNIYKLSISWASYWEYTVNTSIEVVRTADAVHRSQIHKWY